MTKYTIVPLADGPFAGLDALSRMAFGLIWDRYKLSSYNVSGAAGDCEWYDHRREEVFCIFSHVELARLIGCSERTVRRCLGDLKDADVIDWRRCAYGGACRFYVHEHIREYMRPQSIR